MKRRTKPKTKTWYRKKCDELWSKIIRLYGRCERCGRTDTLQAAHIIGRTNFALRWDTVNGVCLCYACHIHWAHKEPLEFVQWLEYRYPTRVAELREKNTQGPVHRSIIEYEQLYDYLKDEYERAEQQYV